MIAPPGWRAVMIGRLGIAGVSVALYAAALALPALDFHKSSGEDSIFAGWETLLMGWYALISASNVGWLANVFYLPGLVLMLAGQRRTAAVLGLLALAFGFHTLRLMGVTFDADEGGVKKMVLMRLDVGFVLWMTAMSAIVPGALLLKDPPRAPPEGGPFVRG